MLIDKLRDYYGIPDAEQTEFINKKTLSLTEAQQNEIANKIIESRSKRFGFPDISVLAKFLNESGKKARGFYWAVCNDCKAEYDYRFESCPKCHLAGKRSSGYKVRTSDEGIPVKVIRWNQTTLRPDKDKTYCVNCENRDTGFCRWFGNPEHTCSASDYEYCECKQCCVIHKKGNQRLLGC